MNIHKGYTTNTLFKSKSWDETSQELRGLRLVAGGNGRRSRKRLVVQTPEKADKLPTDLLPTDRLGIPPRPILQRCDGWISESVRAKARGGFSWDFHYETNTKQLPVDPVGLEIFTNNNKCSDEVSLLSEDDFDENSPLSSTGSNASKNFRFK